MSCDFFNAPFTVNYILAYSVTNPSACPSNTFHLLPQSKHRCTSSPAIYVGPSSSSSCNKNLVKLYSGKNSGGIWKLIRVVESPTPFPTSSPPPAVVNVQIPKVEVSIQIPNYTVETFGNEQKTAFCTDLIAASKYPTSKRNMVYTV